MSDNILKVMAGVACAAFVVTLFVSPVDFAQRQRNITIADARLALERDLRDPDSLKMNVEYSGTYTVCGTFNATNGYGGYVGKKRFIYSVHSLMIDDPAVSSSNLFDKILWQNMCVTS